MLGYAALIVLIILAIRFSVVVGKHRKVIEQYGCSPTCFRALQLSPLLYIPSLLGFIVSIDYLQSVLPIVIGVILLVPGIALGRKVSSRLSTAGIDVAQSASPEVDNAFWLGIGVALFMLGNIAFAFLVNGYSG